MLTAATMVRAIHLEELRGRINALRTTRGLGQVSWTDTPLVAGVTVIKRLHLQELRDALAPLGACPLSDDPLPAAALIAIPHVFELRACVIGFE